MALPLFDEPVAAPAALSRVVPGTPEYHAYWSAFRKGQQGEAAPPAEPDERVNRYLADGFRLGRQARPLPCTKETR